MKIHATGNDPPPKRRRVTALQISNKFKQGKNKAQTRLAQGKNKVKTPANKVKQGKTKLKFFCANISPVGSPAAKPLASIFDLKFLCPDVPDNLGALDQIDLPDVANSPFVRARKDSKGSQTLICERGCQGRNCPLGGEKCGTGGGTVSEQKWSVAFPSAASAPSAVKSEAFCNFPNQIEPIRTLKLFLAADLCLRDPDQTGPKTFLAGETLVPGAASHLLRLSTPFRGFPWLSMWPTHFSRTAADG